MNAIVNITLFCLLCYYSVSADVSFESCVEVLNGCLERRMCYTRVRDLELGCCEKSFVEGIFSLEKQKECMVTKAGSDVEDCTASMGEECFAKYTSFTTENMEKFEALEKSILGAVGFPKNEEACETFMDELEKEEWDRCIKNEDMDLKWACDLMFKVMKNTPLARHYCKADFIECISNSIPENETEALDLSCCKEAIGNKTFYYDIKEECTMRKLHSKLSNCFKSTRKECLSTITTDFVESKESIEKFKKSVQEAVGVPPNVLYCKKYYREAKDMALEVCKNNVDEKLELLCSIIQSIFKNSTEMLQKRRRILLEGNDL